MDIINHILFEDVLVIETIDHKNIHVYSKDRDAVVNYCKAVRGHSPHRVHFFDATHEDECFAQFHEHYYAEWDFPDKAPGWGTAMTVDVDLDILH